MKAREFIAPVLNGKIPAAVSQEIAEIIRAFEGKALAIKVSVAGKKRSLSQNAFYWGAVLPAVHEMFTAAGNDVSEPEVHEYLKEHVGKMVKGITGPDGRRSFVVRSSTELTTTEWETFMDQIRAWAAPLGAEIPFPNEALKSDEIHTGGRTQISEYTNT